MEQEQLIEFKIQLALPAPNIEIAQEVANKAPLKRLCYRELLRSWDWINLNNSKNYAK
jgi:hypothetical protein